MIYSQKGQEIMFFSKHPDQLGAHSALYMVCTRASFLWGEIVGTRRWPFTNLSLLHLWIFFSFFSACDIISTKGFQSSFCQQTMQPTEKSYTRSFACRKCQSSSDSKTWSWWKWLYKCDMVSRYSHCHNFSLFILNLFSWGLCTYMLNWLCHALNP